MDFVNPQFLVDTQWLADHLRDRDVRVLDVTAKLTSKLENRARAECYDEGHIPGSLFFDVASGHGELSDPAASLPWTWPTAERFVETMRRFGVDNDTRVVLVARTPRAGIDNGTMWCTRAWWTMHHFGVDCAVLVGGLEKWESEGRPMSTDVPVVTEAHFQVLDNWERGRAGKADVLAALSSGSACVVDALPADSFDGTGTAYGPRAGHITGAVNVPFRSLVEDERHTALFASATEVKACLDEAGLLEKERVVTYCGGAIAATVDAFALKLFGHDNVAVYDGSLMEWTADPDLPMTNPSA